MPCFRISTFVDSYDVDYVIILAGDHIYKMDYEVMLRQHRDTDADVTIGCLTVPRSEASAFGVMAIDATDRVTSFLEKPKDPPGTPDDPDVTLASMGIYVFKWSFLRDLLIRDAEDPNSSRDFGGDLIPQIVAGGKGDGPSVRGVLRPFHPPRRRPIGATSARSTPTGRRTSTSPASCPNWTCGTPTGRSGPIPKACRPAEIHT